MKCKHIAPVAFLVMSVALMNGCQVFDAFTFPAREVNARNRLESEFQRLPSASGAALLQRVDWHGSGGLKPGCEGGLAFNALYGTNDLSFADVLDFYTSAMPSKGWRLTNKHDFGVDFDKGDEFGLSVSDSYVTQMSRAIVADAQSKYRTLYLVELGTPFQLPLPENCKGD